MPSSPKIVSGMFATLRQPPASLVDSRKMVTFTGTGVTGLGRTRGERVTKAATPMTAMTRQRMKRYARLIGEIAFSSPI